VSPSAGPAWPLPPMCGGQATGRTAASCARCCRCARVSARPAPLPPDRRRRTFRRHSQPGRTRWGRAAWPSGQEAVRSKSRNQWLSVTERAARVSGPFGVRAGRAAPALLKAWPRPPFCVRGSGWHSAAGAGEKLFFEKTSRKPDKLSAVGARA
jgi:hypothetical protein